MLIMLHASRWRPAEVKVIIGKLDKNQDGQIDLREWVSVLFDLFRFMSAGAFENHVNELLVLIKQQQKAQ
jgi:Ca2+-binding EF-hand superfamily protein